MALTVTVEDPRAHDVQVVLRTHREFALAVTPVGDTFVLDVSDLLGPAVTLLGARQDGVLVGIGALKVRSPELAELKSMHTVESSRGRGVGRLLVEELIALARAAGCTTLNLETGSMDAFTPARTLYAGCGFRPCPPFGEYVGSASSYCMTLDLTGGGAAAR